MRLLLEKMTLISAITSLIGTSILGIATITTGGSFALFLTYTFLLAVLLIIAVIVSMVIINNKILNTIGMECDPEKCIKLLKARMKNSNKTGKQLTLLKISVCLIAAGKIDEAVDIIQKLGEFSNNRMGNYARYVLCNNWFEIYMHRSNYQLAWKSLEKMNEMLDLSKFYSFEILKFRNMYIGNTLTLSIEQGNYENTEIFFTQLFDGTKTNSGKVEAKFILGKIYMLSGELDNAKEAFNYVINKGNKLYCVVVAKQFLKDL
jgi:tetratricopeptide (TPR) repeat protein